MMLLAVFSLVTCQLCENSAHPVEAAVVPAPIGSPGPSAEVAGGDQGCNEVWVDVPDMGLRVVCILRAIFTFHCFFPYNFQPYKLLIQLLTFLLPYPLQGLCHHLCVSGSG